MFKNQEVAEQINLLMLEYREKLSESMQVVRQNCSEEEVTQYRKALGKVMGAMIIDIMEPIYKEYPDLKPHDIR